MRFYEFNKIYNYYIIYDLIKEIQNYACSITIEIKFTILYFNNNF